MRERVSAYGGSLDAGPVPDGGWRVSAVLPLGSGPTPGTVPAPGPGTAPGLDPDVAPGPVLAGGDVT
ncbi:hypothetical protein [Planomonospora algeriensis]